MTNLEKAMEMEKEYRKLKFDHKAKIEFGYHDKLKTFGFNDTIEYESAKDEYYFKNSNINIIEIGASQFLQELGNALSLERETLFIVVPEELIVWIGTDNYNNEYCSNNNIPVYNVGYNGGTIVTGNEDVAIGLLVKRQTEKNWLTNKIYLTIKKYFPMTELSGNDMLIDGYKVIGIGNKSINNMYLTTYQITFRAYPNEISNICIIPSNKTVKGLKDFGEINRNSFIGEIKSWLQ